MKKNKYIPVFLIFTLIAAMLFAFPLTSNAATGNWTDSGNYDISWYTNHENDSSYTLDTTAKLAGLAYLANKNNNIDFSGKTINLSGETTYDLSAHYWVPIGKASTYSSGDYSLISTSGKKPFAGIFNGNSALITNMTINSTSDLDCLGLFGYSTGGIENVNVSGSISLGSSTTYAVGGVVGYSEGSIRHCINNVSISVGSGSRHTGGIAGVVMNTYQSGDDSWETTVDYCRNTGAVTAGGRCGGIVGSALSYTDGKVKVDRCDNSGNVTANATGKVWAGGNIGYGMEDMTNCRNTGTIALAGRYMGGVQGILYGYSNNISASMSSCLAAGSYGSGCTDYTVRPLYNSADGNPAVTVSNCLWVDTSHPQAADGATWSGTVEAYGSKTKADAVTILGDAWSVGQTSDTYPVLKWINDNTPLTSGVEPAGATSSSSSTDATDAVYLDGVSGSDSNLGTSKDAPVKTLGKAIQIVASPSVVTKKIYVLNTVTISSNIDVADILSDYSTLSSLDITRSDQFGGYLFDVVSGGTLSLGNVTINGNKNHIFSTRSLINVNGGTLNIGTGTTLKDNLAGNYGGAVRVIAGSVSMTGGSITGNSSISGGAVAILSTSQNSYGTFSMSGGSISSNSAQVYGSAIYQQQYAVYSNTGGSVSGTVYTES
jgi:hypothetical protein